MYHCTEVSFQVQHDMMFLHGLDLHHCPHTHSINAHSYHFEMPLHCVGEAQGNGYVTILSNPIAEYLVNFFLLAMAPVVRIEPNGVQTLLLFDNA